ncbi:MAG: serine/threonine-protein phosphatase [Burkholderiales bacterium]|nr:serine/threonine-protein phosphatase [Burkholderiales bacterium]
MSTSEELRLESASFSHDGGRDYNEDAVGDSDAFGAVRLFMLADGAGGQGGGDVAARTAIAAARSEFMRLPAFSPDTLRRCMISADQAVRGRQLEETRLARMASTFVAFLVDYRLRHALIGNLGDSRCYVFRKESVVAQSYDHSLVQRFIDAGLYPAEKLRVHPKRNVLYASLGANEEAIDPYVTESAIDLSPGDGILLCSDGVWELVDEEALGRLHVMSESAAQWRDHLVAAVRGRMAPGHDNFSALLIRCIASQATAAEDDDKTMPPMSLQPA